MIYLLHATRPIGGTGSASAQHYLGYCEDANLGQRVYEHQHGRSKVSIIHAFLAAGADLLLVRTWPLGTRALERYLKQRGHLALHCPLCRPARELAPWQRGEPQLRQSNVQRKPLYSAPARISGGASSLGSLTGGAGSSPRGRYRAPGTWSAVAEATALAESGGSDSGVTALPTPSTGDRSAGTRQPSTSPAGTGTDQTHSRLPFDGSHQAVIDHLLTRGKAGR